MFCHCKARNVHESITAEQPHSQECLQAGAPFLVFLWLSGRVFGWVGWRQGYSHWASVSFAGFLKVTGLRWLKFHCSPSQIWLTVSLCAVQRQKRCRKLILCVKCSPNQSYTYSMYQKQNHLKTTKHWILSQMFSAVNFWPDILLKGYIIIFSSIVKVKSNGTTKTNNALVYLWLSVQVYWFLLKTTILNINKVTAKIFYIS